MGRCRQLYVWGGVSVFFFRKVPLVTDEPFSFCAFVLTASCPHVRQPRVPFGGGQRVLTGLRGLERCFFHAMRPIARAGPQLRRLTVGLWLRGRRCRPFLWSEQNIYSVAVASTLCDTEGLVASAWCPLLPPAAGLPLACWCPPHGPALVSSFVTENGTSGLVGHPRADFLHALLC